VSAAITVRLSRFGERGAPFSHNLAVVGADPFHDKLLSIVLTLPGAYEDRPWGSVHCKVAKKIFVGWGRNEAGEMEMGFRATRELQAMLVASDPRFSIAKYVGQYGGTDLKLGKRPNWDEVEHLIVESYRLIAPKKLVKELDAKRGVKSPAAARTTPSKTPRARSRG
jgi:predicted DNA-binding protein (MmcQ/YjbR family)